MDIDNVLGLLAQRFGIVESYYDFSGQTRFTNPDTQKALLRANGLSLDNDAMIREAMADIDAQDLDRVSPSELVINSNTACALSLGFEGSWTWQVNCIDTAKSIAQGHIDGQLMLPELASGLYDLVVAGNGRTEVILLLVAPVRSPSITDYADESKLWGLNAALYGLRSKRNFGFGDFEDLASLGEIIARSGSSFLGINPVHAIGTMAEEVISPYSPSHRGMLNTAHIAPDKIPGFDRIAASNAHRTISGSNNPDTCSTHTIDYKLHKLEHKQCLEALFSYFKADAASTQRSEFFQSEYSQDAAVGDFAMFETISELHGDDWRTWPIELQNKEPTELQKFSNEFEDRLTFHRWLQWIASEQLVNVKTRLNQSGMPLGLYLDLAVGSRRSGAESWCNSDVIADNVSIGAPPDQLSPAGQNWQLAAFAPHKLKARKYDAFRGVLRANMRHAGLLRLDHVLGLNRSYWIPDCGSPGAYISQPFEALIALIKIEAERAGTVIIGEDLGLVPEGFRERIRSHGFYGYSVLQYERNDDGNIRDPASNESQVLACFGTHDTPTLHGFNEGRDIDWWSKLGWIDEDGVARAREGRAREVASLEALADNDNVPLAQSVHKALANSPAAMVSIQLDDVLSHIDAQNIPGTTIEHPNWSRQYSPLLEDLPDHPNLVDLAGTMRRSGRCFDNKTD